MKIKIVFFMANLVAGGAERVTVNIIKQLDKKLFDITLVMVLKEGILLEEVPPNVEIIDLNTKRTLFSIFKFRKTIQKIQPHIIYSTMIHTSILQYLALLHIRNKPFIILRNATSPKLLAQEGGHKMTWKFLLTKAYYSANKILAQTPEMKDELIEYYNVPSQKVDIFFNPLDTKGIIEKTHNIHTPFHNKEKINVVAAGRLTHAKAFDVLLNAFKLVVKENNNFMLHIIGKDDGEEKKLKSQLQKLKIEEYINLLGFQSNPYRFFYFSDLFVLSSRREGLPNAILENLYLKKPIISTKCIPFISKLINNGKNGYLVEIEDAEGLASAILKFKTLTQYGFITDYQPTNPNKYFKECN